MGFTLEWKQLKGEIPLPEWKKLIAKLKNVRIKNDCGEISGSDDVENVSFLEFESDDVIICGRAYYGECMVIYRELTTDRPDAMRNPSREYKKSLGICVKMFPNIFSVNPGDRYRLGLKD
jgi:hypothetical protein